MATERSRSWLWLLLLVLAAVATRRLACGGSSSSHDTAAQEDREHAASSPAVHSTSHALVADEPDEDGTVADGLSLTGHVIYPDGRAAAGASVRLLSRPSGAPHAAMPRRVARADGGGAFVFSRQAQGDYLLEAQTDDAVSPTTPVRLVSGAQPVTLMVFPSASLVVHVRSAVDHKPIADAVVKLGVGSGLFGASDAFMLERTDATGAARFRGVAPIDNHPVYAIADGFAGTLDNIRANQHLVADWDVTLDLSPGGDVSGRVIDERGVPIPGAKVGWEPGQGEPEGSYTFVTPLADGGHYVAAVTDASGAFHKTVPPSLGCLVAVHPSHRTAQVCGVRTAIGQPRTGIEIVMKAGAKISGVVVTADGKPAPRAEVIVTEPSWEHIPRLSDSYRSRTTTDAEGRFSFDGVDPMPIALAAWTDDASSDLVEIDLGGGAEKTGVRITLAHTGVITGTVTEEDGGPAPFAIVSYFIAPDVSEMTFVKSEAESRGLALPKTIGASLCDSDGKFRVAGLPPGNYTLRAQRPNATSVPPHYSAVWREKVALGSNVTLVLPGLGTVTGHVVDEDGRPITAYTASFLIYEPAMQNAAMPPGRPMVSGDGALRIENVPANHYIIGVSGPGIVEWRTTHPTEVKGNAVTDLGTIKVTTGVTVTGRVLSRGGEPVRNADVAMTTADKPDVIVHAESDDMGQFSLPVVKRGTAMRVRASTDATTSDWVAVAPGATTVDIVMADPTRGTVKGVIVDPEHSTAERPVLLTLPGTGSPGEGLKPEALTNALDGGQFTLDNVAAGTYLLWVRKAQGKPGDEWVKQPVTVVGAKATSVVIDMTQEPAP